MAFRKKFPAQLPQGVTELKRLTVLAEPFVHPPPLLAGSVPGTKVMQPLEHGKKIDIQDVRPGERTDAFRQGVHLIFPSVVEKDPGGLPLQFLDE